MKIELPTLRAGPDGVHQPGKVLRIPEDISKKEADQLLAGGFAKEVGTPTSDSVEADVKKNTNKPRTANLTSSRTANKKEAVTPNVQPPAQSSADDIQKAASE